MKVTIPHEHVQELRFALAEQVERDEDLIRQTEDEMPSADTSNVVRRLRFYRDPASRLSEQLSLSAGCADEARLERRINQRWSAPRRARQRSSAQTACRHRRRLRLPR
jgi:hypothetical protein